MKKADKPFSLWQKVIATSCGFGYSPFAPGTMGAVFAVLVWLPLYFCLDYPVLMGVTTVLVIVFTILGTRAAGIAEHYWGEDPSRVVMDETVGTWIALLAVPPHCHWGYIVAAFVLFRLFDIFKPLGIRHMESYKGGWGIMADDILAGVYSAILILLYQLIF